MTVADRLSPLEDLWLSYDPEHPADRHAIAVENAFGQIHRHSVRLPLPVPWPHNPPTAAPQFLTDPADRLHQFAGFDAVVITWTAAEAAALAALFTPGHLPSTWGNLRDDGTYAKLVTGGRAPFRDSQPDMAAYFHSLCLYMPATIGKARVLCIKSGLHPAYCGPAVPLVKLIGQICEQVKPRLLITTGTAGGIGAGIHLGDVIVAQQVRFDCQTQFKSEPWAKAVYRTSHLPKDCFRYVSDKMMSANGIKLPGMDPKGHLVIYQPDGSDTDPTIVTTDFFAFDDSTNHFGLEELGQACEMGDAQVARAMQSYPKIAFHAIRCASDPQIPNPTGDIHAAEKAAGETYLRYGVFTCAGSLIACWSVIDGFFNSQPNQRKNSP